MKTKILTAALMGLGVAALAMPAMAEGTTTTTHSGSTVEQTSHKPHQKHHSKIKKSEKTTKETTTIK